ncbi:SGNH/GDSL hydrolase family protein [Pleurocapsales cyanobacterium LEGE 10410]|nr:SGNH/GDSL hydrolase family protein [Pleurocapsales cyanobacterium LEGE 10410]
MFKSNRRRSVFSNRRRSRRRFSWLGAIASVVLFLLVLELLTRIFVDLSGDRSEFAGTEAGTEIERAYRLNFVSDSSPAIADRNSLIARSSPSVGYELVENQESEYWQINEQGFRDTDPVPLTKPRNEVRIFLLGGSTAFGYGNSSNAATIGEQLEKRLQQRLQQQRTSPQLYKPDVLPFEPEKRKQELAKPSKIKPGNYRVVNAAVPGYASGNELAQMALQILQYKPDLIIVLDGYVDLMLPSEQKVTQAPQEYPEPQPTSFVEYLGQLIEPIENQSYLAKMAQNRWLNSPPAENKADFIFDERTDNLVQHLPENEVELQKRVARYIEHQKQMLDLSAAAQVPLIVAIQPEITGRDPSQLTDEEGQITTELGRTYISWVKNSYPTLIEPTTELAKAFPKNMKALNLYRLTDKYPSPSFVDAIHLNEGANEKVAEQLYYAISGFSKMQLVPKQPPAPKPVAPQQQSQQQ